MALDKADSISQINNSFPDNTTGEITPADQRIVSTNAISSNLNLVDDGPQIVTGSASLGLKEIGVNDQSHLPTPSGGAITLAAETFYSFNNNVDIGSNRLIFGNNTVISGIDEQVTSITSSTTGVLFSGTNVTFSIKRLGVFAPNAQIISATGGGATSSHFAFIDHVIVWTSDTIGTSTSMGLFSMISSRFASATTGGLSFFGPHGNLVGVFLLGVTGNGIFLDLGTATFNGVDLNQFAAVTSAGATAISGASGSANINAGGIGSIRYGRFVGTGTSLSGISNNDALWDFLGNDDIGNTRPDGLLSQTDNAIPTVITTINTPVLLAGVWNVIRTSQFTGSTSGRLTYNGGRSIVVPISLATTAAVVSGVNKEVNFYIGLNGSIISNSKVKTNLSAGDTKNQTNIWQLEFQPDDYVEAFVENTTDTINPIIEDAKLRVN